MAVRAAALGAGEAAVDAPAAAEAGGVGAGLRADAGVPGVGAGVSVVADAAATAGGRTILPAPLGRRPVAVGGARVPGAAGAKRGQVARLREAARVSVAEVAAPLLATRGAARLGTTTARPRVAALPADGSPVPAAPPPLPGCRGAREQDCTGASSRSRGPNSCRMVRGGSGQRTISGQRCSGGGGGSTSGRCCRFDSATCGPTGWCPS